MNKTPTVLNKKIAKAGIRLAGMLNNIFKK
jgi:hypothetical protein